MNLGLASAGFAVAVVAGLGLALAVTRADLTDAKRERDGHRACVAAVKGVAAKGQKSVAHPGEVCVAEIATADRKARQLDACELAIAGNETTIGKDAVLTTNGAAIVERCPPRVVGLFREVQSRSAEILGLRGVIDAAEADRNQAVARAELRGRQTAERQQRAQALRESAPRDSDGLLVYDADRLRERWETEP